MRSHRRMVTEVTEAAAPPELVTVTDCAALVVFSAWLPKVRDVGTPRAGPAGSRPPP